MLQMMLSLLFVILGTSHALLDCNSVEILWADGYSAAWPVTGICQIGVRWDWGTSWKWVCIGSNVKRYSYDTGDCSGAANITEPCAGPHCSYRSVCNKGTCDTVEEDYFNGTDKCDGPSGKEFYIPNYCYWNYVTFECVGGGIRTSYYNESIPHCAGNPVNITTYKNDVCYPFDGGVKPNCTPSDSSDSSTAITAGGIVGGILFCIIIGCIIFACRRRKKVYNTNSKQYQQGLLTPATAQPVEQQKVIATNSNPAIQPQTTYIVTQPQQIGPSGNIYMAPQQPQVIYASVQPNMIVNNSIPSQPVNELQQQPVQQMVPIQQIESQQVYQQAKNDNIMPSAPPESLPNANNGILGNVNNNDAPPSYRNLDDEGSNLEANSTMSHE